MDNEKNLTNAEIISLYAVYESEWEHRNNILWVQTFRFFFISIFVMVLPNISSYLSIKLPVLPTKLFSVLGIIISTISYVISLSYGKRLQAISKSLTNLNNFLPHEYRRVRLENVHLGKYFKFRQTILFPLLIYIYQL